MSTVFCRSAVRVLLVSVFLLLGAFMAAAQGPYDDLVAKAQKGDTSVDYKALRMAYAGTKQFNSGIDPKLRLRLAESIKTKKPDEIVKVAQEILKTDFANPNVHLIAATAYQALKDQKKAQFHTGVYVGLVNSIITGADGESMKTAYEIISEDEETAVLTALEMKRSAETKIDENGHKYSVVTATDNATNASAKVYFNIDKVPARTAEAPKQ